MCGIFSVFCSSTPKDLQTIITASQKCQSRGPDNTTSIIKHDGIYVFHRLSINDVSEAGNQPFKNKNGVIMMCNGQIYNWKELKEEFNLNIESTSDCEVILKLYEKIGFVETVKRLYGVFAIVLVDGNDVYLARDRFGVRPLYTGYTNGVAESGVAESGVAESGVLSVCSIPNPLLDFCSNVSQFPIGTTAIYKKNIPDHQLEILYKDEIKIPENRLITKDYFTLVRDALIEAVNIRLLSDRPMGCLLSGGFDSSIITAILCKLSQKKVRTYSIGMRGSTDLYYARKVSEFLGTEHHEVIFTEEEAIKIIPDVIKALGSYCRTTIRASIGMYLLSKYISENSDDVVLMTGEFADESAQGYLYFHNAPNEIESENESMRLLREIHLYDVLRADRCISHWGLEARVPFADRKLTNLIFSIPPSEKVPIEAPDGEGKIEKFLFRKAFEGWLPDEIIWRRKEGFSDGVSSLDKPLYKVIQDYCDRIPKEIVPENFVSKEAFYYKMVFDKLFPTYDLQMVDWMPKWTNTTDPSGRLVGDFFKNNY
jgi:asparagine synthase (glutamine-hydrolysing)